MGATKPGEAEQGTGVRRQGPILRALFDMSFSRFLTLELIKLMYVAAIMIAIVGTATSILIAFSNGIWAGIFSVLIAPLLLLIYIIAWRISLELLIVLFRIAEYSREIAENTSILGRGESQAGHSQ